jgi:glutamate-1-semialdehyde 2,1-aminomutase
MAAGAATVRLLTEDVYVRLECAGARLETGLVAAAAEAGASVRLSRVGSLLTLFVADFPSFFHAMLDAGVMLPPSQHEAWFISTAHGDDDLDATVGAARIALASMEGDR